jgi:hypothetical protein
MAYQEIGKRVEASVATSSQGRTYPQSTGTGRDGSQTMEQKAFTCSKCREPKRGQVDRYCPECRLEYNIAYRALTRGVTGPK